jgi:reductive dehalogenase
MAHEVDHPTYEVVAPIERYDERDNVFSREALLPGSPEEREYHANHPELETVDHRLARYFFAEAEASSVIAGKVQSEALPQSTFRAISALALPDAVDGPVSPQKTLVAPLEMGRNIKAIATRLGAAQVRIGPLNPAWVYTHRGIWPFFSDYRPNPPAFHGVPSRYQGLDYGDPIELSHRYAISMAFPQHPELISSSPSKAASFEIGRVYAASALAAVELANYIRALGYPARAHHLRNYAVLLVPVAVDSGLGELGRCGYLISKELGANFRLSCVTTDLILPADKPLNLGIQDFCEKCLKCAKNCPVNAIPAGDRVVVRGVRKWQMDAERCLLYWGSQGGACAICQVVCPWSKPPSLLHRSIAEIAISLPVARRLLVKADDWVYGSTYRRTAVPRWAGESGTGSKLITGAESYESK